MNQDNFQNIVKWLVYLFAGIFAMGALLDSIANSLDLITVKSSIFFTILIIGIWIYSTKWILRNKPFWGIEDNKIRITKPNIQIKLFFLGVLFVLWIPLLIGIKNTNEILIESEQLEEQKARMLLLISYAEGEMSTDQLLDYIEKISLSENKLELLSGLEFIDTTLFSHNLYSEKVNDLYEKEVRTGMRDGGLELTHPEADARTVIIRNCFDFFDFKDKGYYAMSTVDMINESYFNKTCDIIRSLEKFQPAKKSFIKKIGLLDIEYWPGDLVSYIGPGPEEDDQEFIGKSIKEHVKLSNLKIIKTGSHSISWEFEGSGQYLAELLKGDFNDDGIEDLLIYNHIYSTEATFQYGFTQIWTRRNSIAKFELVE